MPFFCTFVFFLCGQSNVNNDLISFPVVWPLQNGYGFQPNPTPILPFTLFKTFLQPTVNSESGWSNCFYLFCLIFVFFSGSFLIYLEVRARHHPLRWTWSWRGIFVSSMLSATIQCPLAHLSPYCGKLWMTFISQINFYYRCKHYKQMFSLIQMYLISVLEFLGVCWIPVPARLLLLLLKYLSERRKMFL